MIKEGKYIYCIIGTKQERHFGPIGIGGRDDEVSTIGYDDLSMVVSNHPVTKLIVNRENMLAHERIIEEVMKEFTVLPVRFCTIAAGADEIRNLLDRRHREFSNLLRYMAHKVELGVKALWKSMDVIFKEIIEENKEIKKLKEKIRHNANKKNVQSRVELGKMVAQALAKKKEEEAQDIADILKRSSLDHRFNRVINDEMFINAALLVANGREKELDNMMDDLSHEYEDRVKFMYAGPFPPYNFVNITIYPEEWER